MLNKIIRILFSIIGLILGFTLSLTLLRTDFIQNLAIIQQGSFNEILFFVIGTLLGGIIFFIVSPLIVTLVRKITEFIETSIQKMPMNDIFLAIFGLIIGLVITNLFAGSLNNLPYNIGTILVLILNIVLGSIGANIAIKRKEELYNLFSFFKKIGNKQKAQKGEHRVQPKVLDTSVIIDGRIFDICQTGFVEGPLVIPGFVLEELRHIADSSDSLKRNRGRRGLDVLNRIQKELNIPVEMVEKNFEGAVEVDIKLLKLAQMLGGKVVTNDYNLNKVAEFQGVDVLNINELANAVKPVVLPGEEMLIQVIKDGKETGQGIAYLDDGTMIVVDGGRKYIGENIEVVVTSVLQTAAGRMIFAKPKAQMDKAV
ncbi:putative PIN and TRAM-domain containing protein precursor [Oxobacter pfennigii]|uniref:Putative PIN and TRAM-domain containing protein n=1 Tax=Oxobacter pfennigii TaxID=36849 RepID=A0A0P8Y7V7_9CLOT|nr:PIN/TRAM domain-containing protein [Oxobacter pfennigii]KPU42658.1 putative PIN and TRAM-domain containing protein precursor [Oxobacter pfennigii]